MSMFTEEIDEIERMLELTSKAITSCKNKMAQTLMVDDDIVEDTFGCSQVEHGLEIGRLCGELDAMRRTTSELKSRLHNLHNQSLRKSIRFENYVDEALK